MSLWRSVGLRARLALALASVAVLSVALATALANAGLHSRLDQFARERLQQGAAHTAELAANLYRPSGRWTPAIATELRHAAETNGLRLVLLERPGEAPPRLGHIQATAAVLVDGRDVGTISVVPLQGEALTGEDRALHHRLNRLHLLAGGLALALGLLAAALLAPAMARPLRRLTAAARRMEHGDLATRVPDGGAPELRELAGAFNRLAETLDHEERIRRDTAADVAHELRTPLAAIVSRSEAARDGVLADARGNLEALHTEALRLSRLVEDLGKLAEAQQPGLTLEKQPLDLAEIVGERTAIYREYLQAKGIAIDERLAPATAYGDRGRLIQIVDNLLSNALRYTDPGGTVTVELSEGDGEAVLAIADTGIGIRGEDLPYVFERFWRGEPSRARRTGGAGIGLAIVRELVRAHDGRIDVESRPGQGSRFRVVLPAGTPAETAAGRLHA